MSNGNLNYEDIKRIIALMESCSSLDEIHLKYGDLELDLKRQSRGPDLGELKGEIGGLSTPSKHQLPVAEPVMTAETKQLHVVAADERRPTQFPPESVLIKSPMVGSFYAAPSPGAPPFVSVGQPVEREAKLCIIEVMKLMNSIHSSTTGVVTHILVKDGEPVEFGQILMVIDPR